MIMGQASSMAVEGGGMRCYVIPCDEMTLCGMTWNGMAYDGMIRGGVELGIQIVQFRMMSDRRIEQQQW
jgi:hypothetical protein